VALVGIWPPASLNHDSHQSDTGINPGRWFHFLTLSPLWFGFLEGAM